MPEKFEPPEGLWGKSQHDGRRWRPSGIGMPRRPRHRVRSTGSPGQPQAASEAAAAAIDDIAAAPSPAEQAGGLGPEHPDLDSPVVSTSETGARPGPPSQPQEPESRSQRAPLGRGGEPEYTLSPVVGQESGPNSQTRQQTSQPSRSSTIVVDETAGTGSQARVEAPTTEAVGEALMKSAHSKRPQ
jgi:hypothetical protein